MLEVILNRLQIQAEKIDEQAEFKARRSITEQIFNLRILCEKYLQHQQNLCHVLILKKAFEREWFEALWLTKWQFNMSANLVCTIEIEQL